MDESGAGELPSGQQGRGAVAALVVACLAWIILAWYGVMNCRGPEPNSDLAGSGGFRARFSAGRAIETVLELVGDGIPHPAGSEQNDIVRERLVQRVRHLGYLPEIQATSHRRRQLPTGEVVPLENVIFRLPATDPAPGSRTLLVMAHYDSVPTGPGAGDDAAGVAVVIELARLLKSLPERHHHVMFLVTDGEEFGLLGADRFLQEHPEAATVDLCINLEGRGNRGPSHMFQTGPDNAGLIRLLARCLERPFSSSLNELVYRSMPNGTDLAMFLRRGIGGFNFAFIGNVRAYHTPEDSAANLDLRSLQHQGDNAWQVARALVTERQWPDRNGSAVWFDLLGWRLVWWPAGWSGWMAIAAGVVAGLSGWVRMAAGRGPVRALAAIGAWMAIVAVAAVAGILALEGVMWLLQRDDRLAVPWPAGKVPEFLLPALWALALAYTAGVVRLARLARGRRPESAFGDGAAEAAIALCSGLIAGILAFRAVEAVWVVLVPAIAGAAGSLAGAVAAVASRRPTACPGTALLLPLVAGILVLPIVPSVFHALGLSFPWLWPIIATMLAGTMTGPLGWQSSRTLERFSSACLGTGLVLMAAAVIAAHSTPAGG